MPFYQVAQQDHSEQDEYGVCRECGRSAPIVPATMTENGLVCTYCKIAAYRSKRRVAPVTGRILALEAERDQLEQRLSRVASELRDLRDRLRRQAAYGK